MSLALKHQSRLGRTDRLPFELRPRPRPLAERRTKERPKAGAVAIVQVRPTQVIALVRPVSPLLYRARVPRSRGCAACRRTKQSWVCAGTGAIFSTRSYRGLSCDATA